MARTIDLGQIVLTKLQGYQWTVMLNAKGEPIVTETYIVTDNEYTQAPEGQKSLVVKLTDTESIALGHALGKYRDTAAIREGVA